MRTVEKILQDYWQLSEEDQSEFIRRAGIKMVPAQLLRTLKSQAKKRAQIPSEKRPEKMKEEHDKAPDELSGKTNVPSKKTTQNRRASRNIQQHFTSLSFEERAKFIAEMQIDKSKRWKRS